MKDYFKYYIVILNLFGLFIMHVDKEKAKKGKFRIRERTLILVVILGGSIGSYMGMKIFRHKTKHFKFKYGIPFIILVQILIFLYLGNNIISVSHYFVKSNSIPSKFDGYKIVQISDLHNKVFPLKNKKLVENIKNEKPDVIFITGDIIDRRIYSEEKALLLIKQLKKVAPIYYVTGNHEAWSEKFLHLQGELSKNGVIVLRNKGVKVKRGNDVISILGVDDPGFSTRKSKENYNIVKEEIQNIKEEEVYSILLSHRPELFSLYVDEKIDLVFTGHAHGGQVMLPFIGGIIAPNQGFNPKYYKGTYKDKNTSMVVSRGLGNTSIAPIRVLNPPELVVVTINKK